MVDETSWSSFFRELSYNKAGFRDFNFVILDHFTVHNRVAILQEAVKINMLRMFGYQQNRPVVKTRNTTRTVENPTCQQTA